MIFILGKEKKKNLEQQQQQPQLMVVKTFITKTPILAGLSQNSSPSYSFDTKLPSNDSASILNQSSIVNFK